MSRSLKRLQQVNYRRPPKRTPEQEYKFKYVLGQTVRHKRGWTGTIGCYWNSDQYRGFTRDGIATYCVHVNGSPGGREWAWEVELDPVGKILKRPINEHWRKHNPC